MKTVKATAHIGETVHSFTIRARHIEVSTNDDTGSTTLTAKEQPYYPTKEVLFLSGRYPYTYEVIEEREPPLETP